MSTTLRQKWDTVNDRASFKPQSTSEEYAAFTRAISTDIPDFRCKFTTLPGGQYEVSVTPANTTSVINARMGFNPLLDCPRKVRNSAEQEERDIENRERAAKRARQNVRYKTKGIFADHMLTFGYREAVTDRAVVAGHWKEFVRLFRLREPDWQYLAVLEKHESEETSVDKIGSYHIHVAVTGRQNIKWLLRCWLIAIGQHREDVADWFNSGIKLGDKSLGSVNVQAPNRKFGGTAKKWKSGKLSSYLSKYIGKTFEECDKGAKKYWHSKIGQKTVTERFWLKATNFYDAIKEAHEIIYRKGAMDISIYADESLGVVWITGEVPKNALSWEHCEQCEPDFDAPF